MKVGTRVLTGFGIAAVIAPAVGVAGYEGVVKVSKQAAELGESRLPRLQALTRLVLGQVLTEHQVGIGSPSAA